MEFIDQGVNNDDLNREGLVGSELNFKYAFLNSIILNANDPESYSPDEPLEPFPKLPTLDDYTLTDIISWGETDSPKRKEIREFIVSLGGLKDRLKGGGRWIKNQAGKIVGWVLDGTNKYIDSVNAVIPYLGAVKEIKGFLELGIDAADTFKNKK